MRSSASPLVRIMFPSESACPFFNHMLFGCYSESSMLFEVEIVRLIEPVRLELAPNWNGRKVLFSLEAAN